MAFSGPGAGNFPLVIMARSAGLSSGSPSVPAHGLRGCPGFYAQCQDSGSASQRTWSHWPLAVLHGSDRHLTPLCPLAWPRCFLDLQQASYSIQKIPLCSVVVIMCLGSSKTSLEVWMSSKPSLPGPKQEEGRCAPLPVLSGALGIAWAISP